MVLCKGIPITDGGGASNEYEGERGCYADGGSAFQVANNELRVEGIG